jgi:hypothetical protein
MSFSDTIDVLPAIENRTPVTGTQSTPPLKRGSKRPASKPSE